MARLTKSRVEQVLTDGLRLADAVFTLEKSGSRIVGHVVSPTFRGVKPHKRQMNIWDALVAALGTEAFKLVGMILAYTPEEWNFDEVEVNEETLPKKRRKTG